MPRREMPDFRLTHIAGREWAVFDEDGRAVCTGDLRRCEDWLDAFENARPREASESPAGRSADQTLAGRLSAVVGFVLFSVVALPVLAGKRAAAAFGPRRGAGRSRPSR